MNYEAVTLWEINERNRAESRAESRASQNQPMAVQDFDDIRNYVLKMIIRMRRTRINAAIV